MEKIQQAIRNGDYEEADFLFQEYIKASSGQYDDTAAIMDAAIREHYGDRAGMREAIRKGLLFNCRNYELYLMLGNCCLPENSYQAYLCYENALFHCSTYEDKKIIEDLLRQFEMQYGILVPKVSIVILSYDLLDYTKVCIESIRRTIPESAREIVVVDNGSSDGSVEWLRAQPDIILVENKENRGFPGGCNQGIQASSGDSDIFLLNNDTMLPENALFWLRMGLYEKEKNGSAGSVSNYAGGQVVESGLNQIPDLLAFGEKTNIPMPHPYEDRLFLSGFALLIKRSVIDEVGFLDERFFPGNNEDVDLGLRILKAGYRNVLCKNSFILHFGSKTFHKDVQGYQETAARNRSKINEKWGFDVDYYLHPKEELIKMIEEPAEQPIRILDAACGCGASMGYIRGMYPNAQAYGIESDPGLAELASHMGDVVCGKLEESDLLWEEESFDYILVGDVLEHVSEPEKVLKNIGKYLKKGGYVIAEAANVRHYSAVITLLKQGVFPHKKKYSQTELQKLLIENGYKTEKVNAVEIGKPDEREQIFVEMLSAFTDISNKEFITYKYVIKAAKS